MLPPHVTVKTIDEGTAILAQDFADVARELGLSEKDLAEARSVMTEVSIIKEALVLAAQGVTAMHDVTRGGLLETLLEIAHLSGVGIEVDASRLPIPPVISRFAREFQFDPLRMISSGTLTATVSPEQVEGASRALKEAGVPCADVGRVTEGIGVRVIRDTETVHHTEIRCEEDELARMWALYPRDC